MTRSLQAVAYPRPSVLRAGAEGRLLGLETSRGATPTGAQDHPTFFSGFLTRPQAAAAGLLAVADVAAADYRRPRPAASLDPVVTGNGDRLRFESFSGCCGVYARLDVLSGGLDGGDVGHGTTNVDVNNPLRARALGDLVALAAECAERTGAGDAVAGLDEVADRRGSSRLVTQARRLRTALRVAGSRPGGSVV